MPTATTTETTQPPPAQDDALAAAVAVVLLNAVNVAGAMTGLAVAYKAAGIPHLAMRAALGVVMAHPPGQDGFWADAGRQMARQNLLRRAQFTVAAARRLSSDIGQAVSNHQSVMQALSDGIQRERRFYGQHLMATWARQRAGAQVDTAAQTYGRLLGWHTVRDSRTSKECRDADGKNFFADHVPLIGYPGAVHPNCRCRPGAPFPHGAILPSYGLRLRRAA